jgi:hypothetical protein
MESWRSICPQFWTRPVHLCVTSTVTIQHLSAGCVWYLITVFDRSTKPNQGRTSIAGVLLHVTHDLPLPLLLPAAHRLHPGQWIRNNRGVTFSINSIIADIPSKNEPIHHKPSQFKVGNFNSNCFILAVWRTHCLLGLSP